MNHRVMTNCIDTLLKHGNGSHTLGDKGLARIAHYQGFDPTEFKAAFLEAETRKSLSPSNTCQEYDK